MGVFTTPGKTAFILIFLLANSNALDFTIPKTADFDEQ